MLRSVYRIYRLSLFKKTKLFTKQTPASQVLNLQSKQKISTHQNNNYVNNKNIKLMNKNKKDRMELQLEQKQPGEYVQLDGRQDINQQKQYHQSQLSQPMLQQISKSSVKSQNSNQRIKKIKEIADILNDDELQVKKIVGMLIKDKITSKQRQYLLKNLLCAFDFTSKAKHRCYHAALLVIGLHNSKIGFQFLRDRAFIYFFSIYNQQTFLFDNRFGTMQISDNQNYKAKFKDKVTEQQKQLIINEILKNFQAFYLNFRQKFLRTKYKSHLYHFLTELQEKKLSLETVNHIIDVLLILLTFQQDNQVDKFKASRIFRIILTNFIYNVESNPQIAQNLHFYQSFKQIFEGPLYLKLLLNPKSSQQVREQHLHKKASILQMMAKITKLLTYCSYNSSQHMRKFVKLLVSDKLFAKNQSNLTLLRFYSITFLRLIGEMDQDGNNPVLQRIKHLSRVNPSFKNFINSNKNSEFGLFHNMIRYRFHRAYLKMESHIIEGHVVIKQKPIPPVLDDFQKELYKNHEKTILINKTLKVLMSKFYPELIMSKNISQIYERQNNNQIKDNQIGGRLAQALTSLNISYKRQEFVYTRQVDFLLQNNIIIQCDGDIHIDFQNMNVTFRTSFRNYMLMLLGYRIVVICMHEINQNRTLKGIQELVKKKLRILKQNEAYLVQ